MIAWYWAMVIGISAFTLGVFLGMLQVFKWIRKKTAKKPFEILKEALNRWVS